MTNDPLTQHGEPFKRDDREQEIRDAFAGRNGWRRLATDEQVRAALDEAWETAQVAAASRAAAAAMLATDDSDRVAALQKALRYADQALEETLAVLEGRATVGGLAELVSSARHEAKVALSLDHGEA